MQQPADTRASVPSHPVLADVLSAADRGFERSTARLCDFLRIPSVSTDPAFDHETRRCAEWLVAELRGLGFMAEAARTIGHPMVVAHHPGVGPEAATRPRILYDGHSDVQPADPLELWT